MTIIRCESSMKTLKIKLEVLYTKGWYSQIPTKEEAVRLGVQHTLDCVKEWLQQKQFSGSPTRIKYYKDLREELLEELQ